MTPTVDLSWIADLHCLAGRTWTSTDLAGGLTNHNLRVTTTGAGEPLDLVVRRFGSDAGLLGIDRDAEHADSVRAAEAGVGAPVREYRPDLGVLVVEFLPGRTLADADLTDPDTLTRAATACRRLHGGPRFVSDFDMFARQATYRAAVRDRGFPLPATYDDHAAAWDAVRRALAAHAAPTVPCNNDLLAANFIDDGVAVRLIDYEYSGNNDPFFELGNTTAECGFSDDQTDGYLAAYLERVPTAAERARVRLQALASAYGWSLWGFIQAATSPLDFDFAAWGAERFEKAQATFRGPDLPRLLDQVGSGG